MAYIDSATAKDKLIEINEILREPHLIIGGLAVKQYINARESKDIDLVCDHETAMSIQGKLFPTDYWTSEDLKDDEYRPDLRFKHLYKDYSIYFGPKILERSPYENLNWDSLKEEGKPFKVKNTLLEKIIVPSPHALAYSKFLSFLSRTNGKELQDLKDFSDLTNHPEFSLIGFWRFLIKSNNHVKIQSDFIAKIKNKKYHEYFKISSISKFVDFFEGYKNANPLISLQQGVENPILNKLNIDPIKSNAEYGIISSIPEEKFKPLRRELLNIPTKKLIIVGASLSEAFNGGDKRNEAYLGGIISKKLSTVDDILNEVEIFITDPTFLDEPINNLLGDRPVKRIGTTLDDFVAISTKILPTKSLKIYFIPLLQLDHLVITDEHIISRNTMLWSGINNNFGLDEHGFKIEIKGTWLFGQKTKNIYSLYNSYQRYLTILKENSLRVPLDEKFSIEIAQNSNSKGTELIYSFRNHISKNINNDNISIHKLYTRQLTSYVRSTWEPQFRNTFNELIWTNEDSILNGDSIIRTIKDLQNPQNLLNDKTQNLLIPYIKQTETLLDEVAKKYDKKEGFAKIIPSLELGVPNNVQRLAGGFATGSLVLWKCGTPIIPIDTTVNICTSSVFEVKQDIFKDFTESKYNDIKLKGLNAGYLSNFEDGNHFITYGHNPEKSKFFLVLHSSAKEFKYSALGLYPHQKSWFKDKIKVHHSNDKKRYLRYLKDSDAVNFYNIVKKIDTHNIDTHQWFAEQIIGKNNFEKIVQKHHYFMPTASSVAIGTFLLNENEIVPIFSDRQKEIVLVRAKSNWSVNLGNENKIMIPHGWGQEFRNNHQSIDVDYKSNKIKIGNIEYDISEKSSFGNDDIARVRNFTNQSDFINTGSNFMNVSIEETIIPAISVSKYKYEIFK